MLVMTPPSRQSEVDNSLNETIHERQKAEDKKESTEVIAPTNNFAEPYTNKHNKLSLKDRIKAFVDISTILLLFGITLFTGSAWWVFKEQLYEMERAYAPIKESAEAARASAEAAKASAEAAKAAVELSDRTAERRLRAYIDISDIGINIITVAGGNDAQLLGVLVIKNFGATPSDNIEISARTIFRKYPLGSISLPERSKNPIVTARFAPGQERKVNVPMEEPAITAEQRAAWEKEAIAAYFYGTIKYDDIFERTCIIYFKVLRSKTDGDSSRFASDGNLVQCSKPAPAPEPP
jgi:hypothetical protein